MRDISFGCVLSVLLFLGLSTGCSSENVEAEAARAELEAARAEAAEDRAELEARIASLELDVARLRARRLLDLAVRDIDDRNFGLAQRRIGGAAEAMREGQGEDEAAASLASELAELRVVVAEDFEGQRRSLLELLRRADALFDDGLPPSSSPPTPNSETVSPAAGEEQGS